MGLYLQLKKNSSQVERAMIIPVSSFLTRTMKTWKRGWRLGGGGGGGGGGWGQGKEHQFWSN